MTAAKKATAPGRVGTKKPADRSHKVTKGEVALPAGALPRKVVTFLDRPMEVKAPTPETLARWGRDIQKFEQHKNVSSAEDMAAYADLVDNLWDALFGLFIHDEDIKWMKEGVKKNDISILNAHTIMTQAAGAYENRAARRGK